MSRFVLTTVRLALLALLGQTIVAPLLTFGGVGPDFALIALVLLAFAEGALAATIGGFALGLVMDGSVPNLLGLHALTHTLTGFGLGRFRERMVPGMALLEGLVVAVAAMAMDTLYAMVSGLSVGTPFVRPLFLEILPSAIVTGLVAVPLIRVAIWSGLIRCDD